MIFSLMFLYLIKNYYMIKKFYKKIYLFFYGLFFGFKSADKLLNAQSNSEDAVNAPTNVQQSITNKSVLDDLILKKETQEVKELRYEMYEVERRSHDYVYVGGGKAIKKNKVFDYKGYVDRSDGYPIMIVQNNDIITHGITSNIHNPIMNNNKLINPRTQNEYRIKIERNFLSKFTIEHYLKKIVIKNVINNDILVDLYISKYSYRYEPTSKLFQNEMKQIFDKKQINDIFVFNSIHFTTKNAWGLSDLMKVSLHDFKFVDIIEFDGCYVLKFYAKIDGVEDLIKEFYDEEIAKKYENHEKRENAVVDFENENFKLMKNNIDVSNEINIINQTKNSN